MKTNTTKSQNLSVVQKLGQKKWVIIIPLLIVIVVVALEVGGATNFFGQSPQETTKTDGTINFNPPTEQELKETEQHKEEVKKRVELENNPETSSPKTVTPIISSWGQNPDSQDIEVAAFITGIYEDGGTCTLKLTMGNSTVTKTSTGLKDVNKTACQPFIIPEQELSSGDWQIQVNYKSDSASGSSGVQVLKVK